VKHHNEHGHVKHAHAKAKVHLCGGPMSQAKAQGYHYIHGGV